MNTNRETGHVLIEGQKLRYIICGDGPPLILLCTLSGSWSNQVKELSEKYTVITYDMRSFGASREEGFDYPTNEEHAEDLAKLIQHLGLEKPLIVGLSHGGIVLQHFALRYQDMASGFAFVATHAKPFGQTRLLLTLLNDFLDDHDDGRFWKVLRTLLFSEPGFDNFVARENALKRLMFNQFTTACLSNIYTGALAHDSASWLREVHTPSLVIGGQEDVLFPPKQTQFIADQLSNAKIKLLACAHLPPVESSADFNRTIDEFYMELLHG